MLTNDKIVKTPLFDIAIIFLSQHDSPQMVFEAFKSGGDGYVTKVDAVSELLEAVRAVFAGKRFVSKRIRLEWPTENPFFKIESI